MKKTDSDIQYAVSIKEDTVYMCRHFTKHHKGNKINKPYLENPIRRIQVIECEDSGRYQTWLIPSVYVGIKSLLEVTAVKISLLEDMDSESAHMVDTSKVSMLKPENGNSAPKTTVMEGVEKVIPPTTIEEKA
ncbi:hypothetical protein Tco_1228765 [Tanacetum coccineum]